jgi:hypothetical protein
VGKAAGQFVGDEGIPLKAHIIQEVHGHVIPFPILASTESSHPGRRKGDDEILIGRKIIEEPYHLKGAGNAEAGYGIRLLAGDILSSIDNPA